jgi:uroporphyrinogen-III synthase
MPSRINKITLTRTSPLTACGFALGAWHAANLEMYRALSRKRRTVIMSLAQRTIALAEGRQLEELAQMLEREGATTLPCPLVSILDAPDAGPVIAWLKNLAAGAFSHVILLTGEGLRRLLGFAERAGLRDSVLAALTKTRTVTRGPKPVRALKEVGLNPALVAAEPTTDGVIAALRSEDLQGKVVGVQLYKETNAPLVDFLQAAGATARTVLPYVYAPAADVDHVVHLIERMAQGQVDAIVFTSSPQVDRLFEVAGERAVTQDLGKALATTRVAAVGPIVAENLRSRGVKVEICPDQGFVMKNLVQHLKRAFA